MLGLHYFVGFSLVVERGGYSLVVVHGLPIAVAPFVAERGLWAAQASVAAAPGLQRTGSIFVAHRPSCSAACGIFPDQELNPCLLHWPADSLPLSKQGSPGFNFRCNFKVELMVLVKRLNSGRERVESRMTSMFFIQVSRRSKLPFIEMQKTTKGTSLG